MKIYLENLVQDAISGNKKALSQLVEEIQNYIYSLCLRTLWDPEEAKESTQEVLIKIVTRLSSFKNESQFKTWCYRLTVNHLIDHHRKLKNPSLSFQFFENDLLENQQAPDPIDSQTNPEYQSLLNQLRLSCTTALLQCLDINHRLSYILGEILEMDHNEVSQILEVESSTHRKRLERARAKILEFTSKNCGFLNGDKAKCQCPKKTSSFQKRCSGKAKYLTEKTVLGYAETKDYIQKIEGLKKAATHYRSQGTFISNTDFKELLVSLQVK